ncbi:MAG: type II toxin-antitoxin system RatA family toxin [Ideonella sp.]
MELSHSVLVPYPVESMFDLIEHAESYPLFVPWCVGATIFERSDDRVAARLEFSFMTVRFGFRTDNAKRRPDWLQVRLVEGPFRHFQGDWQLTRLGDFGCRIHFAVSYEIADGLLDRLAAPAVGHVSRAMIDAFVKRAEQTFGAAGASASAAALPATVPSSQPPAPVAAPSPP